MRLQAPPRAKSSSIISYDAYFFTALLCVTAFFITADQQAMAPCMSAIAKDFGMTDLEKDDMLGGQISLGFFFIGGIVGLLVGHMADTCTHSISRAKLYSVVVLLGRFGSLGTYLSRGFPSLLVSRTITGISVGGSSPIIFSLLGDIWPSSYRVNVASAVGLSMSFGAALGQVLSAFLSPTHGWRLAFLVILVPTVVCAVMLAVVTEPRPYAGPAAISVAFGSNNNMREHRKDDDDEEEEEDEDDEEGGQRSPIGKGDDRERERERERLLDAVGAQSGDLGLASPAAAKKSYLASSPYLSLAATRAGVCAAAGDDACLPPLASPASEPIAARVEWERGEGGDKDKDKKGSRSPPTRSEVGISSSSSSSSSVEIGSPTSKLATPAWRGSGSGKQIETKQQQQQQLAKIGKQGNATGGVTSTYTSGWVSTIWDILSVPTASLILSQGIFGCIPWSILSVYFNDFLQHDLRLSVHTSTLLMAVFGLGATAGAVGGGWLGQRLLNRDPRQQALLMGVSTICAAVPLLLIINHDYVVMYLKAAAAAHHHSPTSVDPLSPFTGSGAAAAALNPMPWPGTQYFFLFFAAGLLAAVNGPNVRSVLSNVTTTKNRGMAFALYVLCDDVGKGAGPFVVAKIINWTQSRKEAFDIGVMGWCVSGVLCLSIIPHVLHDMRDRRFRPKKLFP